MDGVKGNLNDTFVLLGLVLHVFISCCLSVLCCHQVVVTFGFASTSRVTGGEDHCTGQITGGEDCFQNDL